MKIAKGLLLMALLLLMAGSAAADVYQTYDLAWSGASFNNQATMHGGPWGTPNSFSGDFNLFFTDGGPFGTYYFTLTTSGGYGDPMLLTEFAPVRLTSTPEGGTFVLFGIGILGLTGVLRRRLDL